MAIFNCYVSSPEGRWLGLHSRLLDDRLYKDSQLSQKDNVALTYTSSWFPQQFWCPNPMEEGHYFSS